MPLTVLFGNPNSGKTSFLNELYEAQGGIYLRQYHNMRPYVVVRKIPHFEPTSLPFWFAYKSKHKDATVQVGGTIGDMTISGLTPGQRKFLLLELVYQRIRSHSHPLIILLDEPFVGVADDDIPFILERLSQLCQKHNIVLATSDHDTRVLELAENIVKVSSRDRSMATVNERRRTRENAIVGLMFGDQFEYSGNTVKEDLEFFIETEIVLHRSFWKTLFMSFVVYILMIMCLWNSTTDNIGIVLLGFELGTMCTLNLYTKNLVDWRILTKDEMMGLIHTRARLFQFLQLSLTLLLLIISTAIEYAAINVVINGFGRPIFFTSLQFNNFSGVLTYVLLGLYSDLQHKSVIMISGITYLGALFLSTALSPGSGIMYVKTLRYLSPRFYFWCLLPVVGNEMQGCPAEEINTIEYMILTSFLGLYILGIVQIICEIVKKRSKKEKPRTQGFHPSRQIEHVEMEHSESKKKGLSSIHNSKHKRSKHKTKQDEAIEFTLIEEDDKSSSGTNSFYDDADDDWEQVP